MSGSPGNKIGVFLQYVFAWFAGSMTGGIADQLVFPDSVPFTPISLVTGIFAVGLLYAHRSGNLDWMESTGGWGETWSDKSVAYAMIEYGLFVGFLAAIGQLILLGAGVIPFGLENGLIDDKASDLLVSIPLALIALFVRYKGDNTLPQKQELLIAGFSATGLGTFLMIVLGVFIYVARVGTDLIKSWLG